MVNKIIRHTLYVCTLQVIKSLIIKSNKNLLSNCKRNSEELSIQCGPQSIYLKPSTVGTIQSSDISLARLIRDRNLHYFDKYLDPTVMK